MLTALSTADKTNFETLARAIRNGDHALVRARRKVDGREVALVGAFQGDVDGGIAFIPLAVLAEGNPYEAFEPAFPEDSDADAV